MNKSTLVVSVLEGQLAIKQVILDLGKGPLEIVADVVAKPGHPVTVSIPKSQSIKEQK